MSSIGEQIREARERKGLSQEKLAAIAGVSQTTIDKIERGVTKKSRLLHYIATALDLNVQELDPEMYGSPPPKSPKSVIENRSGPKLFSAEDILPLYATEQVESDPGSKLEEGSPFVKIGISPLDYVPRPSFLKESPDAYALYISDSLMAPEFDAGDIAFVDPKLPFVKGSTVILLPSNHTDLRVMGRLIDVTTDKWEIMQWLRNHSISFNRSDWPRLSRIVAKYYRR